MKLHLQDGEETAKAVQVSSSWFAKLYRQKGMAPQLQDEDCEVAQFRKPHLEA